MLEPFSLTCTGRAHPGLLVKGGPLLPVLITVPHVIADQNSFAPFHRCPALIDTGAAVTCVSAKVAQELGLRETIAGVRLGGVEPIAVKREG